MLCLESHIQNIKNLKKKIQLYEDIKYVHRKIQNLSINDNKNGQLKSIKTL